MPNNNVHVLTKDELDYLKQNYIFKLNDNMILCIKGNQTTVHRIDKKFSINSKMCTMKISIMAMEMWKEYFKDDYSLIEVQNAINKLIVSYQTLQKDEVEKMLKHN